MRGWDWWVSDSGVPAGRLIAVCLQEVRRRSRLSPPGVAVVTAELLHLLFHCLRACSDGGEFYGCGFLSQGLLSAFLVSVAVCVFWLSCCASCIHISTPSLPHAMFVHTYSVCVLLHSVCSHLHNLFSQLYAVCVHVYNA